MAGRTSRLTRGTTREELDFDAGGRMFLRREWSGATLLHDDSHTFDPATGEPTRVDALRETVLQARRGLGALAWVDNYDVLKGTRNVEYFGTDPLANQISMRMQGFGAMEVLPSPEQNESEVHAYEPHTGRLLATSLPGSAGPFEFSLYDAAGNQYYRQGRRGDVATPHTFETHPERSAPATRPGRANWRQG